MTMSPGLPEPQGDRGDAQGQRQKAVLPHLAVRDPRQEVYTVTLKGAVKPNPSAHKCFVSLTETSDRIEKMIVSNDDCIYPVSVPVPHRNDTSDDNNNSMEDIGVVRDLSCYACGYLAEH